MTNPKPISGGVDRFWFVYDISDNLNSLSGITARSSAKNLVGMCIKLMKDEVIISEKSENFNFCQVGQHRDSSPMDQAVTLSPVQGATLAQL